MSIFEGIYRNPETNNFDLLAQSGPFGLSVQASSRAYSKPREDYDHLDDYDFFEVALIEFVENSYYGFVFLSEKDGFSEIFSLLTDYRAESSDVYAYVPRKVVEKIFDLFVYS